MASIKEETTAGDTPEQQMMLLLQDSSLENDLFMNGKNHDSNNHNLDVVDHHHRQPSPHQVPGRAQGSGYDAIVIGSGYGGAVAAFRLAQEGLKVCVLEKGRRWESPNFPTNFVQMLKNTAWKSPFGTIGKENSLFQIHVDRDCLAMTGAGVGGGSLINAGVVAPTPSRTRKDPRWPKEWEKDWSKYEALSSAMLEPETIPYTFAKKEIMDLIKDEIEDVQDGPKNIKVSMRFRDVSNVAGVKQNACNSCGNCITGCNFNAKNSVDKNYMASALQAGVELRTETKVLCVAETPKEQAVCQGTTGVCECASWRCGDVDSSSYNSSDYKQVVSFEPEDARAAANRSRRRWRVYLDEVTYLSADIVVLAGGVFGTTEILLRSRERGLNLSERLGKGVSCNGNNISFISNSPAPTNGYGIDSATFTSVPTPERPGVSICNSYTSSAGYTIQGATYPKNFPYSFLKLWTYGSALDWNVPSVLWAQVKIWAQSKGSSNLVLNMMGYDEADGEITLDKTTGRVRFVAPHDPNMVKKLAACHRLAKRMKAELLVCKFRSASVHLLGGCNAAEDPKHGVANADGQIFAPIPSDETASRLHPGLYVCDGSLIPCAVGINPSNSITIAAERVAAAAVQYSRTLNAVSALKARRSAEVARGGVGLMAKGNKVQQQVDVASGLEPLSGQQQLEMMHWAKEPQSTKEKISSADDFSQQAPIIVRETLRGQVAGLACELNVIMHMGQDEEDCSEKRRFGDPHKFLRGRVGGNVIIPCVDSDVLYILDGSVDLCWKDERTPYTQYMHYHLLLVSATGARYILNGKKEMRPFLGGVFGWDESRTLLVKFQQIAPAHTGASTKLSNGVAACQDSGHHEDNQQQPNVYPVLEGTLTVSLVELLKSTITLQGSEKFTFAKLLVESLMRTYILKNPRVVTQQKHTADSQKAIQALATPKTLYPCHVIHDITTDDGARISARQWINPDKSENPRSSNVVLLLNGHSTEGFWLPTEPTDLVRTLLESGYEPWLLNTRLSPLHIPDRQFNLDDPAKYDIPAALTKIEEVRGDRLPIHVVAHCVGGLHIHMAILGGHVHISRVASLLCTNTSMFFSVIKLSMAKLFLPLMPICMAILGEDTAFRFQPTSEGGLRHQVLRFLFQQIPRQECCADIACETFAGVFGNSFWHANVTPSVHAKYTTPDIAPLSALPHLRKIILKGHLIDAVGRDIYMPYPERLAVPTTYINGGREVLVTQKTGRLGHEFMKRHHPQFVHVHHVVSEYGHADLLLGENSSKDVFPLIIEHLGRVRDGQHYSQGKWNEKLKPLQQWELERSSKTFFEGHFLLVYGFIFVLVQSFLLCMIMMR